MPCSGITAAPSVGGRISATDRRTREQSTTYQDLKDPRGRPHRTQNQRGQKDPSREQRGPEDPSGEHGDVPCSNVQ
jgi:hypothetical protein